MARPLRIEYAGAVYHVMARGNHGGRLFRDDQDRQCFLRTLGEACVRTGWRIHAYVLMGNHYHLLVETPEGNLVSGMKWIQGAYTQRYNGRHQLRGHLFQGRYKAVVVASGGGDYFQVVSTYIHLNPARAGKRAKWLETKRVLGSLALRSSAVKGYESYIEGRVLELGSKAGRKELEVEWKALRRGWYVGDEAFGEELQEHVGKAMAGRREESHSGPAKEAHGEAAAEAGLERALALLGLNASGLREMRKGAPQKLALAWWLRAKTTVSLRWVSERLAMGHSTRVTQAVRQMEGRPNSELKRIRRQLEQLERPKPTPWRHIL